MECLAINYKRGWIELRCSVDCSLFCLCEGGSDGGCMYKYLTVILKQIGTYAIAIVLFIFCIFLLLSCLLSFSEAKIIKR